VGVRPSVRSARPLLPLALAAILLAGCPASLPFGGKEGRQAAEAYSSYRHALASRDRAALRALVDGKGAAELDGPDADARLYGKALLLPRTVTVLSTEVEGDGATVRLREGASVLLSKGKKIPPFPPVPQASAFAEGTVRMVRQGGRWRLAEEKWSREPAPARPAPLPFRDAGRTPAASLSFAGHEEEISGAAFAADGRIVTTGLSDRTIRMWDGSTGALVAADRDESPIRSLAVTPDGRTAAAASDGGKVVLRDVIPTGFGPPVTLPGNGGARPQLAASADGSLLAAASVDRKITVWSVTERRTILSVATADPLHSVAFSPAAPILAAGSAGNALYLLDLAKGEGRRIVVPDVKEDSDLSGVAFSPDGKRLAVSHVDGTVTLWDVETQELAGRSSVAGSPNWAVAFSPDGTVFATAAQGNLVRLWDGRTAAPAGTLAGHGRTPRALSFRPDGGALVSAGTGGEALLWR
jgi:DNA-binding beta-propeller fold protein YncE